MPGCVFALAGVFCFRQILSLFFLCVRSKFQIFVRETINFLEMKIERLYGAIMFMAFVAFVMASCKKTEKPSVAVIEDGIRFCESTLPYGDGVLIANFGTDELNPLNSEGKGYIVLWKEGEGVRTVVPADGNLSAPKGMFERDNYLYVCDVNKVAVYNLNGDSCSFVRAIAFPEGNLFVNDLAATDTVLYASVTNTDKIFKIDISDVSNPGEAVEWLSLPGPNGLSVSGNEMFVASYPADGNTRDVHVIYRIPDVNAPVPEKVISASGQYDGIVLSEDKSSLYVSNWTPAGVSKINLATGEITPVSVDVETPLVGPADMSLSGGKIYIPDLPNSRVVVIDATGCGDK